MNRVMAELKANPHRTPQKQVLAVSGTPRKGGNSDILAKEIMKGLEERDIKATPCYLRDHQFQGCIGCEACRKDKICTALNDGMTLLYPDIMESQGLILVSPAHNYNITAWMKAFIDRLYCFYNFDNERPRGWSSNLAGQKRKAVVAAICEQENQEDMGFTIEAMTVPLKALGYEVVDTLSVFGIFDKARVRDNEKAMKEARHLGTQLGKALREDSPQR